MDREQLDNLKKWFSAYCRSFSTADPEDQKNFDLKEKHTHNVCDNMVRIARGLSLSEDNVLLAEALALFHDVGRFPQYRTYRTFRDDRSTNHAALGAKVLIDNKTLEELPQDEQTLILRGVTLHNVFVIPPGLDPETLAFVKMVRDADKLDIWRVFIEYFTQPEAERPTAAGLDLPDTPGNSSEVIEAFLGGQLVRLTQLKNLNDFKLLQLAWIYDLNFSESCRMALERKYCDTIAASLPSDDGVAKALRLVRDYLERKTQEP
jgi:hypothetical protein